MTKNYTQEELNNMSVKELQTLNEQLSNMLECQGEKQFIEGLSQLTSILDIKEVLDTYLLYNEPCSVISIEPRNQIG
jgi:hypothetical protein